MHQGPVTQAARALPVISGDQLPRRLWERAQLEPLNRASRFLPQQFQRSTSAEMPNLIGPQHPMPSTDHPSRQQEINHRAAVSLLAIAALNQQFGAMAFAVEATLWMGLQHQIIDQLLVGRELRHKKSPVCTEPLGVCEE